MRKLGIPLKTPNSMCCRGVTIWTANGLHFNDLGHAVLAQRLKDFNDTL